MDEHTGGRRIMILTDAAWEWLLEGAKQTGLWYKGRPSRTAFVEWLAKNVPLEQVTGGRDGNRND